MLRPLRALLSVVVCAGLLVSACGGCPSTTFPRTQHASLSAGSVSVDGAAPRTYLAATFDFQPSVNMPWLEIEFGPNWDGANASSGSRFTCPLERVPVSGSYPLSSLCRCASAGCTGPYFEVRLSSTDTVIAPLEGVAGTITVALTGDVAHVFDLALTLELPRTTLAGTDVQGRARQVELELRGVQARLHQDELTVQDTCGSDAFGHVGSKG